MEIVGRFVKRSTDRVDMIFETAGGSVVHVDPFVGCVVLPNDYDPYSDDARDYIEPHDYQIKEDELYGKDWVVRGNWFQGAKMVFLAGSIHEALPTPPQPAD